MVVVTLPSSRVDTLATPLRLEVTQQGVSTLSSHRGAIQVSLLREAVTPDTLRTSLVLTPTCPKVDGVVSLDSELPEAGCHRGIQEDRRQGNNPHQTTLELLLAKTPHSPACLGLEDPHLQDQGHLQDQWHLGHLGHLPLILGFVAP